MKTIYSYTRVQALEDGVLHDVSEVAREAGIRVPVAITNNVMHDVVNWDEIDSKKACQDVKGRLWDVLWMLRANCDANKDKQEFIYTLNVIPRSPSICTKAIPMQLKAVIHGGDHHEPVITVMLPNED